MFLERKFSGQQGDQDVFDPPLCPVLPKADWSSFPLMVRDVVSNIQLLLKARRGYDHLLTDFGLSPSEGRVGNEALLERTQLELPETLRRYEPRFSLTETDFEADDDGVMHMVVSGTIRQLPGRFSFRFALASRKIVGLDFQPEE